MLGTLSPLETAKFVAAKRAVDFVEDGMKLGLGSGSTASWMVKSLAERIKNEALNVTCVASSERTAKLARDVGIKIVSLEDAQWLDLTIDGADEVDPAFNLVKGGGGSLLKEKIVATASDRMIVIADASKSVATLGAFPLAVEVTPFGLAVTQTLIAQALEGQDVLGHEIVLRKSAGEAFVTDEGNHILDLYLKTIGDPRKLSLVLNQIAGVVENGLFVDICDLVITGHGSGDRGARVEVNDLSSNSPLVTKTPFANLDNIFVE